MTTTTTCLSRISLITWLGTDGRGQLLTALPPPRDIPPALKAGKNYLTKLAYHLKGNER